VNRRDDASSEVRVARFDADRGSLIPEFALAAPLLIFGLLAIFEFGMGYRERINMSSAVRSTARQATNLGEARQADYEALKGYVSVMARAKNIQTNRVVIYRAAAGGAPFVASCLTTVPAETTGAGTDDECNIYSATQLSTLGASYTTHFGGVAPDLDDECSPTAWDRRWCPVERKSDQGDPPDYLGVYMNVSYESYTRLLPSTVTMTDRAVMRIEPKLLGP
jgi:hypothetical protein